MTHRWQYCLSTAMITRWHYSISMDGECVFKNFGLQEENINISNPQRNTTN